MAVQEEHQAKRPPHPAASPAETTQDQEGAARAVAAATEDRARHDDAAEIPASDQAPGVTSPQEAPQVTQDASLTNTQVLVKHPMYFIKTVLQDMRARYPMPQKLLLALLVASRKLQYYF